MYWSVPYIESWFDAAGAADRRLEPRVAGDRVVGRGSRRSSSRRCPSRPASTHGMLLEGVHRAEQVHHFLVAPVGEDRLLEGVAAAVAAAIVHREHDVAVRGEQLALEVEGVLVLAVRTAVDPQQRGILPRRDRTSRGFTTRPLTSVPSALVDVKSSVVPELDACSATRRSGATACAARPPRARGPRAAAWRSRPAPRTLRPGRVRGCRSHGVLRSGASLRPPAAGTLPTWTARSSMIVKNSVEPSADQCALDDRPIERLRSAGAAVPPRPGSRSAAPGRRRSS